MWNKKMIKNAGAVAVILVCILIATGILGYGIKKNESKTLFNLRLKNGEELYVWFDQVTKELINYILYY